MGFCIEMNYILLPTSPNFGGNFRCNLQMVAVQKRLQSYEKSTKSNKALGENIYRNISTDKRNVLEKVYKSSNILERFPLRETFHNSKENNGTEIKIKSRKENFKFLAKF